MPVESSASRIFKRLMYISYTGILHLKVCTRTCIIYNCIIWPLTNIHKTLYFSSYFYFYDYFLNIKTWSQTISDYASAIVYQTLFWMGKIILYFLSFFEEFWIWYGFLVKINWTELSWFYNIGYCIYFQVNSGECGQPWLCAPSRES